MEARDVFFIRKESKLVANNSNRQYMANHYNRREWSIANATSSVMPIHQNNTSRIHAKIAALGGHRDARAIALPRGLTEVKNRLRPRIHETPRVFDETRVISNPNTLVQRSRPGIPNHSVYAPRYSSSSLFEYLRHREECFKRHLTNNPNFDSISLPRLQHSGMEILPKHQIEIFDDGNAFPFHKASDVSFRLPTFATENNAWSIESIERNKEVLRKRAMNEGIQRDQNKSPRKKAKLEMLDILCSTTLELGPIQANPSAGCSCPRSHCIKLYCDCFKAGRPCSTVCSCFNCKNTDEETKIDGERIQAIKNTLARNPRAFTGGKKEAVPQNPGDVVCNCLKSQCLKLYCNCFHSRRFCNDACLCISCSNTPSENYVGGKRNVAIKACLEKRSDAFTKKTKEVGAGCACKNNRCLKKYW
jgi:Tesmin/TSO1-like CXC domain, cysteine-rich domain